MGSWKLADALKNGASDNMGETRPFPIDHYGAARKLLEDTADEMKTGAALCVRWTQSSNVYPWKLTMHGKSETPHLNFRA